MEVKELLGDLIKNRKAESREIIKKILLGLQVSGIVWKF